MNIKKICLYICISCLTSCNQPNLSINEIDLISFDRGYLLWHEDLSFDRMPYNVEALIQGIRAAAQGKELAISEEELAPIVQKFQKILVMQRKKANLAEAEAYLRNIAKESSEIIPSQLYFKKTQEGLGRAMSMSDIPFFKYSVKTIDEGIETDVFETDEAPVQIHLENTIPGFIEGVMGMREGERRRLYIHPDLTQENYGYIPNKLLIIDVELCQIARD